MRNPTTKEPTYSLAEMSHPRFLQDCLDELSSPRPEPFTLSLAAEHLDWMRACKTPVLEALYQRWSRHSHRSSYVKEFLDYAIECAPNNTLEEMVVVLRKDRESLLTVFVDVTRSDASQYQLHFKRADLSPHSSAWTQAYFTECGVKDGMNDFRLVRDSDEYAQLLQGDSSFKLVVDAVRDRAIQFLLDLMEKEVKQNETEAPPSRLASLSRPVRSSQVLRVLSREHGSGFSHLALPFPPREEPLLPRSDVSYGSFYIPPRDSLPETVSMLGVVGPNETGEMFAPYHAVPGVGMVAGIWDVYGNPYLCVGAAA